MIPIVKPVLPNANDYEKLIAEVFERQYLTNGGPLLQELEAKLATYFDVPYLLLVANGTLALQIAFKALDIKGSAITTPFTFAATANALLAEGIKPIFSDIDALSFNLNTSSINEEVLQEANAIVPVHVYGNSCDVVAIEELANKYQLKVVYDAAHAFGSSFDGKSLLSFGDAATISLHATKVFHTVEGGAIAFRDKNDYLKAKQLINFGFDSQNFPEFAGINAKMSEIHAGMGLALFDQIPTITKRRQDLINTYFHRLNKYVQFPNFDNKCPANGSYAPIVLNSEDELIAVQRYLTDNSVQSRRYFYPSLSEQPLYDSTANTPIANDIARRVLCLPIFYDMSSEQQEKVIELTINALMAVRGGDYE